MEQKIFIVVNYVRMDIIYRGKSFNRTGPRLIPQCVVSTLNMKQALLESNFSRFLARVVRHKPFETSKCLWWTDIINLVTVSTSEAKSLKIDLAIHRRTGLIKEPLTYTFTSILFDVISFEAVHTCSLTFNDKSLLRFLSSFQCDQIGSFCSTLAIFESY